MAQVNWTELDGVTTVWAEAEGPVYAEIIFRTGRADETLPTSGVTHLIEHLALSSIDDPNRCHNGFVDTTMTGFSTTGTLDEVTALLERLCRNLTSLPGEFLEREKWVLAAEQASDDGNPCGSLLCERFGTVGFGLAGTSQLGLSAASIEHLGEYARRVFVKQNAILLLSAAPPKALRLELPEGEKQPLPALKPVLAEHPCHCREMSESGVVTSSLVTRSSAATVLCQVAETRLIARLRSERAVSYSPSVHYEPLNRDVAHFCMLADGAPSRWQELANSFEEILASLDAIDEAEVEIAKAAVLKEMVGTLAPVGRDSILIELEVAARDWLLGRRPESIHSIAEGIRQVGVSEFENAAREAKNSVIVALPSGVVPRTWALKLAAPPAAPVVQGTERRSVDAPFARERLVSGEEGVSVLLTRQAHLTVRYDDLSGLLTFDDGAVVLLGRDGAQIVVEPQMWRGGGQAVQEIRSRVPEALVIECGERPLEQVRAPETNAFQRLVGRWRAGLGYILTFAGGLAAAGALIAGAGGLVSGRITLASEQTFFVTVAAVGAVLALRTGKGMIATSRNASGLLDEDKIGGTADVPYGPIRDTYVQCSDPLGAKPSVARLAIVQPELAAGSLGARIDRLRGRGSVLFRLSEHLDLGDTREAIVVTTDPLVVAAYSDDHDAVALLRYPDHLAAEHDLEVSSRLLTVNTFLRPRASDLVFGPAATDSWGDFVPLIAEFFCEDTDKIARRKREISESDWDRVSRMAAAAQASGAVPRDGRPIPTFRRAASALKNEGPF